ncbi:MAG: NOP5/NOP56 family protein [Methanomicrobiales archaeon]
MKCYLTYCIAGFFAFNENCTLLDYELFQKRKIAKKIIEIQKGDMTPEEELILKRLVKKYDIICIETSSGSKKYKNLKESNKFEFKSFHKCGDYLREHITSIVCETGFTDSNENYKEIIHSVSIEIANHQLKEASQAEDMFLIQTINAIDELEEAIGKFIERIREWYSIHFPEMDKIRNHEKYVQLIAEYGNRDSIINHSESDPDFDIGKIKVTSGADLEPIDQRIIQNYASSIKSLQETKKSLIGYLDDKMEDIAPNIKDLVGSSLGAKIISHAGGIRKLALLPSSTVQIMGAEKALFRHKKTGERPPKHGLIYQHPDIRSSKWWIRGKIARTLAGKISLAARKDFFSGEFDPDIKENYLKNVEKIKKAYPFPKRTKKGKEDKKSKKKKRKKISKKKIKDYYY